jgi:hypothetical protein
LLSEIASVDSYTTSEKQLKHIKSKIPNGRDINLNVWNGSGLDIEKQYDLVFINGPNGAPKEGEGKELAIQAAMEHSDRIIMRNAGRIYEAMLQDQFLRPDFSLISRNGWHQGKCHYWKRKENAQETRKGT